MTKINNKEEMEQFLSENAEGVCVTKFSATWCNPCRTLAETIEAVQPLDGVTFAEVDVDDADEDFVDEYNVRNIPLLVFFKNGLQIGRNVGLLNEEQLRNKIKEMQEK